MVSPVYAGVFLLQCAPKILSHSDRRSEGKSIGIFRISRTEVCEIVKKLRRIGLSGLMLQFAPDFHAVVLFGIEEESSVAVTSLHAKGVEKRIDETDPLHLVLPIQFPINFGHEESEDPGN